MVDQLHQEVFVNPVATIGLAAAMGENQGEVVDLIRKGS
jgi:hypothetical protein